MRWILFLLALGTGFALALDYHLQPRQIAEGVWLLEGTTDNFAAENGGNIVNVGFIETADGVVVIDTGPSRRYGEALRQSIEKTTGKPVLRVLLTHHHPDHVLGNQAFAGVPIAALPETTRLLAEQGDAMAENMYRLVGDWMRGTEVVLPTEDVQEGALEIGGRRLQLLALRGHTGADLAILDERTGVLFAGDILFYQRADHPEQPRAGCVAGRSGSLAGPVVAAERARSRPRRHGCRTLRADARLPGLARWAAA